MRKKIGIGLIVFSTALWMFSFIMNFPNAISSYQEVSHVGWRGLLMTSGLYLFFLVVGIFLIRKEKISIEQRNKSNINLKP